MASYARLSTDESGRLPAEPSGSRKHLPLLAFAAGLLLTVGYYEAPGLGLAMPAASPASSSSSSSSSLALSADADLAGSGYGGFVVAGEQSPAAAAQELAAARAALTGAQRLADSRECVACSVCLLSEVCHALASSSGYRFFPRTLTNGWWVHLWPLIHRRGRGAAAVG
jgi:hypothetical protein